MTSQSLAGWWTGLVLGISCAAACHAEPTAATAPSARPGAAAPAAATRPSADAIRLLVGQLGADASRTREQAQEQLLALGEAARAELERQLPAQSNLEVIARVNTILSALDEARVYGTTLVSLHLRDARAADAFADLAAQANVQLTPAGDDAPWAERRVTLECDRQPMWSALLQLCKQAGAKFVSSNPDGTIVLAPVGPNDAPAPYAVAGPFLLTVKRIENTRMVEFDGPRDPNATPGCRISFCLWAEPKIKSAGLTLKALDELKTDASEKPQVTFVGMSGIGGRADPSRVHSIGFRGSLGTARRIERLRMPGAFTVVGRSDTITVENVLTAGKVERRLGGYDYVIKDVNRIVEGQYAYSLEVRPGSHTPAEFSGLSAIFEHGFAQLLDADGQALAPVGGGGRYGPDAIAWTNHVRCDFGNGKKVGPPDRLVWRVPVETRLLTLPVEFTDLPLP